jgi:glutamate N-acetyltransferase/amino-acid N-acetyltransferase
MATMLAYIFTDAVLPAAVLQPLLAASVDRSFNCMTVDGDTSTSDTVLLCATQQAPHRPVASPGDRRLRGFRRALDAVTVDLAQQVARDGEGAQKFVTIEVTGAATFRAARRIVMAVGKAGEKIAPGRLAIAIGRLPILAGGGPVPGYDETPVAEHMKGREITIAVDVGVGGGKATVWTCDLTHGYIDINASYRS